MGNSFLINLGSYVYLFMIVLVVKFWVDSFDIIKSLPNSFQGIGTIIWLMLLFSTLRFPRMVSDKFERDNEDDS